MRMTSRVLLLSLILMLMGCEHASQSQASQCKKDLGHDAVILTYLEAYFLSPEPRVESVPLECLVEPQMLDAHHLRANQLAEQWNLFRPRRSVELEQLRRKDEVFNGKLRIHLEQLNKKTTFFVRFQGRLANQRLAEIEFHWESSKTSAEEQGEQEEVLSSPLLFSLGPTTLSFECQKRAEGNGQGLKLRLERDSVRQEQVSLHMAQSEAGQFEMDIRCGEKAWQIPIEFSEKSDLRLQRLNLQSLPERKSLVRRDKTSRAYRKQNSQKSKRALKALEKYFDIEVTN